MRLWALALSIGVPDALFWNLTIRELEAVVERHLDMERARTLRAAMIAATIANVHRAPGAPLVQPRDFIKEPLREEDFMSVEESRTMLNRWAASINADYAAGRLPGPPGPAVPTENLPDLHVEVPIP